MILLYYILISITPLDCAPFIRGLTDTPAEVFMSFMNETRSLDKAKIAIVMMKDLLSEKELDDGVLLLLHRINNVHRLKPLNILETTSKERSDFTVFLFRIAKK